MDTKVSDLLIVSCVNGPQVPSIGTLKSVVHGKEKSHDRPKVGDL